MTIDHRMSGGEKSPPGGGVPSVWVARHAFGIPAGGRVLDVACGSGRNFAPILAAGGRVVGVDRDLSTARTVWRDDARVSLREQDLETGEPPSFRGETFSAVVVANYLWRPLLADIVAAVACDGLLIYETFRRGHERLGRPRNPEFLLRPGELLTAVAGRLCVVAFEEVRLSDPDRLVQRIVAVGSRHRWAVDDAPRGSA